MLLVKYKTNQKTSFPSKYIHSLMSVSRNTLGEAGIHFQSGTWKWLQTIILLMKFINLSPNRQLLKWNPYGAQPSIFV